MTKQGKSSIKVSMSLENSSSASDTQRKSSGMPLHHLCISGRLKLPVSLPVHIQALHSHLHCWKGDWGRGAGGRLWREPGDLNVCWGCPCSQGSVYGSSFSRTALSSSVQFSFSVMSDSFWPHGLQHARLPCPSPTPGARSDSCPSSWWCHPTMFLLYKKAKRYWLPKDRKRVNIITFRCLGFCE